VSDPFDEAVHAYAAERVAALEGRLRLPETGAFHALSAIVPLAPMMAEIYPGCSEAALVKLTYGLCAFSDAVIWTDDVIDYAGANPAAARDLPNVAVIFAEAYRTFAEVVGGEPRFWNALARYFIEYVDALADEAQIAAGELAWEACTEERCLAIARGKNGLVRLVDAAVAALAGCAQRPGADEILLTWFVGEQMLDDYNDWREDVRDGNVSVLLRSVCDTRPSLDATDAIGVRMYLQGHADRVLGLASAHLERAAAIAREFGAARFTALIDKRRERIAPLRGRIADAIAATC
jgi:hypothetical protein